ncbi:MAG: FadR family transcriptional regulator [Actinomycetota bacterium]|jgi:GntR family transcriptional repressor for pyruvate dehydrogenase complex|nr:FadR family transcriptional regulator [Actinomycetota bacterium]
MSEALRPVPRTRLYEQLVQHLLQHVRDAGLGAGDRLPPERELAARLGVSRNSLKQAFVVLEVQGLVDIRQGDGTYLRRTDLTPEPIEVLLERRQRLPDVLEAREALEVKLAELAAVRRTDDDLAALDDALAAMRTAVAAGDLGGEGDRRFHAAVAAAGRSPLLQGFYEALAPQISETRRESLRQPGRPEQSLAQHERIAAAVRDGDADGAVRAVREHVRAVGAVRLLDWQPDEGAG